MGENRVEFEMSEAEVRTAYGGLCDQHVVQTELRQARNRLLGRLMARLKNDAWVGEGGGSFDLTETDARALVDLLKREPGAPRELSLALSDRIPFEDAAGPGF